MRELLFLENLNGRFGEPRAKYALVFESHAPAPQGAGSSPPAQIKKAPFRELLLFVLAERVGFEPTVRFNVRLISSQVHSTTLPPLQVLLCCCGLLKLPGPFERGAILAWGARVWGEVFHSFHSCKPEWTIRRASREVRARLRIPRACPAGGRLLSAATNKKSSLAGVMPFS